MYNLGLSDADRQLIASLFENPLSMPRRRRDRFALTRLISRLREKGVTTEAFHQRTRVDSMKPSKAWGRGLE